MISEAAFTKIIIISSRTSRPMRVEVSFLRETTYVLGFFFVKKCQRTLCWCQFACLQECDSPNIFLNAWESDITQLQISSIIQDGGSACWREWHEWQVFGVDLLMWQRRLREVVHEEQGFSGFQVGLKKRKPSSFPREYTWNCIYSCLNLMVKNYFNLRKCTYTYTWIPRCATLSQLVWQPTYPFQKARHVTILSKNSWFF